MLIPHLTDFIVFISKIEILTPQRFHGMMIMFSSVLLVLNGSKSSASLLGGDEDDEKGFISFVERAC